MAGYSALRKAQLGPETTAGTAVACTNIWRGPVESFKDEYTINYIEEDVGAAYSTTRGVKSAHSTTLSLPSTALTFEQFPHLCEMGIKNVGAGVADGVGSGYIYTYPFHGTTISVPQSYTFRVGNNQAVDRATYCYAEEFTLEANPQEHWMMSAKLRGQEQTSDSFTGALSTITTNTPVFGNSTLYMDDVSGTIGTTAISSTLLGAKFTFSSGFSPVFYGDGALIYSDIAFDRGAAGISLSLTYAHNASGGALFGFYSAYTPKLWRLEIQGEALTTAGTDYTYKTVIVDVAGRIVTHSELGKLNGLDIITVEIEGRYDMSAATAGQIIVVNELTTIT